MNKPKMSEFFSEILAFSDMFGSNCSYDWVFIQTYIDFYTNIYLNKNTVITKM